MSLINKQTFGLEDVKASAELIAKNAIADMKHFDSARYSYAWTSPEKLTVFRNNRPYYVFEIGEEKAH